MPNPFRLKVVFAAFIAFLVCQPTIAQQREVFQRQDDVIYFTALSKTSPTQVYFITLLAYALRKSEEEYGAFELQDYPIPMDQARQIETVQSGEADVMWTMATPEREALLLPVKFPLLKGLLGKRVFLVTAEKEHAFKFDSLAELQQRKAIQGQSWPDTKILQRNGFNVSAVSWYEWQFGVSKLLLNGQVDYFPRSVVEAKAELGLPYNKGLAIEAHHLLEYPAFIYFFVAPSKPELHQRLLKGLQKGQEDGTFEEMLSSYPGYQSAQSILRQPRKRHTLINEP